MGFDAYDVLALSRSATSSDVSRAYRRLALKYHPDKDASPQAAEKFLEVAKAYDILHERTTRQGHTREPRPPARPPGTAVPDAPTNTQQTTGV